MAPTISVATPSGAGAVMIGVGTVTPSSQSECCEVTDAPLVLRIGNAVDS